MSNERSQMWIVLEAVLVCVVFAALYSAGGSADFGGMKWLRRFLAPGLFSIWAFLRSGMDWRYLVQMPCMFGSLCLGYGGQDTIWGKVFVRGLFGLGNGVSSSVANGINKRWLLVAMQVLIVTGVSIGAGAYNPFPNAIVEQFVIGFIIIFIPAMSVKNKNK